MAAFEERMDRMVVKAVSPSGAVTARYSRHERFMFEVEPKAMNALDAQSLSDEATSALLGVLDGIRQGVGMARGREAPPTSLPARHDSDPPLTPRQQFQYAMADIDVTGSASGGLVNVDWHAQWEAAVRLKPSVANRMDAAELGAAMGLATADALRARAKAMVPLIRQTLNTRLTRSVGHGN